MLNIIYLEFHIKQLQTFIKSNLKINSTKNINKVNKIDDSIGFYFNESPEVKSHINKEPKIKIIIDKVTSPFINIDDDNQVINDILAMVLIDTSMI